MRAEHRGEDRAGVGHERDAPAGESVALDVADGPDAPSGVDESHRPAAAQRHAGGVGDRGQLRRRCPCAEPKTTPPPSPRSAARWSCSGRAESGTPSITRSTGSSRSSERRHARAAVHRRVLRVDEVRRAAASRAAQHLGRHPVAERALGARWRRRPRSSVARADDPAGAARQTPRLLDRRGRRTGRLHNLASRP